MHKFAELNSARAAQLFADYCTARGLDVSAVVHSNEFAELFTVELQLAEVEFEFEQFLQQPTNPRYQAGAWQLSQPAQGGDSVLPRLNPLALWRETPVTLVTLILCLLIYVWQQVDWRGSITLLQLSEPAQVWRWFTPVLLHFSLTHLVFNLVWWWYLGRQLEQRQGTIRLLNIMFSVALVSNAAQYFLVGPQFGGMSGVVYGLFGYFWLTGRLDPKQQLSLSNGMAGFMLLWLVLGFMDALWISMANWAHLGGLIAGLAWAWLLKYQQSP